MASQTGLLHLGDPLREQAQLQGSLQVWDLMLLLGPRVTVPHWDLMSLFHTCRSPRRRVAPQLIPRVGSNVTPSPPLSLPLSLCRRFAELRRGKGLGRLVAVWPRRQQHRVG